MSYAPNVNQLQQVNSTTYVDVVGLQLGLPRLLGETSEAYLKRLQYAARFTRTAPYQGLLNEISLALGVEPAQYISLEFTGSITPVITVSIAGVTIGSNSPIPLFTFDQDTMWDWQMLSEVVAGINQLSGVSATLLVTDGPAMQLARQTNSLWSFAENVTSNPYQLQYAGPTIGADVIVGSELFNITVPSYTLTSTGLINFSAEPTAGTQITYNYLISPYNVVGSPVGLIGLTDPEFASVAETTNGVLAYQVNEFVQTIMETDLSYWGP
jgi:hypothetical protein